ncbi:MAG TPA: condensation domain-containing protein, partial [Streptosporangiaceae bacterium]|nr:condensation domain-containing protein [Streptosporangiaceae bacterium]
MSESLARRLAELSPERRRLVLERLRGREAAARVGPAPRQARGALPLSFAQERLWFLWRLAPGSTAYNAPSAVRLHGRLDVPALRAALAGVVARHEILRTRYAERDGAVVQVVDPPAAVDLPVIEVPADGDAERGERALRALVDAASEEPFDLAAGPVLRARLYRLGPSEHVLLLAMHHICCDGWSLPIIWQQLSAEYRVAGPSAAGDLGDRGDLGAVGLQYADFAWWQRERARAGGFAEGLDFWGSQLAGLPVVELPADR